MYNSAAANAYATRLAKPPPPGQPHGIPITDSERPGRSAVYRHWRFLNKPLIHTLDPKVLTVHDLFESSVQAFANQPCLGYRPWLPASQSWSNEFKWMTYKQVGDRRKHFGAGLVEIHEKVRPAASRYGVGIWSQNRPEWQIADLGCMSQSLFSVSLYETLGPDACEYILQHAELSCVVASLPHISTLLKIAPRLSHLKFIICIDPLYQGEQKDFSMLDVLREIFVHLDIQIFTMEEVEKLGQASQRPMSPPRPEDIYTINYTSGTTGPPKGVVLTHACTLAGNCGARIGSPMTKNDVALSYLPLAHLLERLIQHGGLAAGARFGFFRGDLNLLVEDIKTLQPTAFVSVPRLFNRFSAAIRASTVEARGFKGRLSRHILTTKLASMSSPPGKATNKDWLYDRTWTPKVKDAIGFSKVHTLVSGSAPLDPQVQNFLAATLATKFHQGYGLTESSGIATLQLEGDFQVGTVGPPSPCVEICLESLPELEYSTQDEPYPRGEILLRGPAIFAGYFKNDEETSQVLDSDGWFHTGDIGQVDSLGRFSIIDRKKNILKLAQGEYVAPERLENILTSNCKLVSSVFIHGDGAQSTLIAIINVNPETFAPFCTKILGQELASTDLMSLEEAVKNPQVNSELLRILDNIGKGNKFNGYERVKAILLAVEPFTVDNGLLTPTLKFKRSQIVRAFRSEIDRMYAEIEMKETLRTKL